MYTKVFRNKKLVFAIIITTFILIFLIWGFQCQWAYYSIIMDGKSIDVDGPIYNYEKLPNFLQSIFSWNKSVNSCR